MGVNTANESKVKRSWGLLVWWSPPWNVHVHQSNGPREGRYVLPFYMKKKKSGVKQACWYKERNLAARRNGERSEPFNSSPTPPGKVSACLTAFFRSIPASLGWLRGGKDGSLQQARMIRLSDTG